jgi:uncharacterized protein
MKRVSVAFPGWQVFFVLIAACVTLSDCRHREGEIPDITVPDTTAQKTLVGKSVLFVYGGWEGHQPVVLRDRFVPWLQSEGASVIASSSLDIYADSTVMANTDLIIQTWTLGQISGPQINGLLRAVRNGTGFAGWHGGIVDAFRPSLEYHMLTGGQFIAHPGNLIAHDIHVADPSDPVMHGVNPFAVHTEQYYMLTDPNIHVLATTTFSGEHLDWIAGRTMPVIWKHRYGMGRVFVTAIGHQPSDFDVPEVDLTLKRGIRWAVK